MESENSNATPVKKRGWLPQFSLLTVLLVTAVVAIGIVYFDNQAKIATIRNQLNGLEAIDRSLVIDDPNKVYVVGRMATRFGECIYDIHVPETPKFQLHLALDQVDQKDLALPTKSILLRPGKCSIEIRQMDGDTTSVIQVLVDEKVVIKETRDKDWNPRKGSSGSGDISHLEQFDVDATVVLYRKRFMVDQGNGTSSAPNGPGAGVLLWLEPSPSADRE